MFYKYVFQKTCLSFLEKTIYKFMVRIINLHNFLFFNIIMTEDQKRQLEKQLRNIANTLRGKMDADEFRNYILGFIFYKYLSEKMHLYANKLLSEDDMDFNDIDENSQEWKAMLETIKFETLDKLGFFLKPSELFDELAMRGWNKWNENNFILEDLVRILRSVEASTMWTESEDDFVWLFEDLDLSHPKLWKTESAKNELISTILNHLGQIDFQIENSEIDVLGDAYEYLIGKFASWAGKKAGEFYTPQAVSTILAKLVTSWKSKIKNVYDPTCGSGSLLLRVSKEVEAVWEFCGQELNRTTYNLARMNMILHGIHYKKFDIQQEDTLEHPQHIDKRFEAIVANPPFSANRSANPLHMNDDRFSQYGRLAPSSKADFAFVQHMIHHLDDNGTMAIVLPHGVLFRGGAEWHIRQYLIEDRNYLDAVIGLPANIFYGTSIPTCILVFKKCRKNDKDVLFIDASKEFEKVKNQNILRPEHIDKIIQSYQDREEEDKFSYVAKLDEIKENDYNLNIPRYVDTFEEEDVVDIKEVAEKIIKIDQESKDLDNKIQWFCDELGIKSPF